MEGSNYQMPSEATYVSCMIDTFQVTCTENSHLGTYTRTNAELPLET